MDAEKKIVAYYQEEIKKEFALLKQAGVEVIELQGAEREKFLKVASDEAWKDIVTKNPQTGPKLKELLTKK